MPCFEKIFNKKPSKKWSVRIADGTCSVDFSFQTWPGWDSPAACSASTTLGSSGGGVIMVVSVGKLRRLVNVWVYRGYPVQLLCRCEWENHLSKTIFPAMFDDTGGWPTKIYLILVINTGNIARNMSTSGIEVGNIGMTKHST